MKNKKEAPACGTRLGKVGGGALIEGVMMRAGDEVAVTCRTEDGKLHLLREKHTPLRKKYRICNLPILRGIINFIESLVLSMHTLNVSADFFAGEESEGRVEKWMKKHLGFGLFDILSVFATVLGVLLSIGLFLYLPKAAVDGIEWLASYSFPLWAEGVIEGGLKVAIFVLYIWLVSLMRDIRRTFAYHGAEHKSIACYEAGEELTPENARKHSRFHPRCGTSFMFVMILLGVVIGISLRYILPAEVRDIGWLYTVIRLLLLPLVVGLGFEFIMLAGKHPNRLTAILSAPGMWMQRLTTREPDDGMLEVAILSLKAALPEEFPELDTAAYEKKADGDAHAGAQADEGDSAEEAAPTEKAPAAHADTEKNELPPDEVNAP